MAKKKKIDYFDIFEEQTAVAVKEAELLSEAIKNFVDTEHLKPIMEQVHELENEGDKLNHQVYKNVAVDFITPIDRDDLLTMTKRLDDVADEIEEILVALYIYDVKSVHEDTQEFADLILASCKSLHRCMSDFRNFKKSKTFKQQVVEINDHEEAGDRLYRKAIRELHMNCGDNPMRVLVWSRVFEHMESCCDACEHVADTMSDIILKNS